MASECFNLVCERFKVLFPDPSHELCPEKWLDDIFHTLKTGEGRYMYLRYLLSLCIVYYHKTI